MPATLEELARFASAEKTFAVDPLWLYDAQDSDAYILTVPLSVDYVVQEGFFLNAQCKKILPDQEVSLSLLYKPAAGLSGPLCRFDWKPLHSHQNHGSVKGEYAWKRFHETHVHPFDLNCALGWIRMARENLPVAMPVGDPLNTFRDMLSYVGETWRIRDIQRIQEPQWEPRLT